MLFACLFFIPYVVSASQGDCANHQPATIFQCPVSCGLCDTEGQFCSDLYLGKCKIDRTLQCSPLILICSRLFV